MPRAASTPGAGPAGLRSTVAGMDPVSRTSAGPASSRAGSGRLRHGWSSWWGEAIESARDRNARGWYLGAAFGLCYQAISLYAVWSDGSSLGNRIAATLLLVPLFAGFALIPPLVWRKPLADRAIAFGLYGAYSLIFFAFLGSAAFWLWVLVAVVAVVAFEEALIVIPVVVVLAGVPLVYGATTGFADSSAFASILIFSVAAMMFGMNQQIRAVRELRQAQGEIARLAVVEERARFSRDMHDVLGHSLTVVTVKSELARRLVRRDPAEAEKEIADIERLARSALTDLRAAVAGYREMSLATELAVAQAALAAANIEAHVPASADVVDPRYRELFGWVLREGITNVIRHSGAHNCWVELGPLRMRVEDDGRGADADGGGGRARGGVGVDSVASPECETAARGLAGAGSGRIGGSGLPGLRQRAAEYGARLTCGVRDCGGFFLDVRADAT